MERNHPKNGMLKFVVKFAESDWGILNLNILNQVQVGWHLVNFDASGNLNSKCSYIADGAGFEYL